MDNSIHNWPPKDDHVWGEWSQGLRTDAPGGATQYRVCVHPNCKAVDTRKAPRA